MVDSQSPPIPLILSPCSSGRRSSCDSKSPEFEFWMVRNRINFPQPDLLSADELFSDGFILPLRPLDLLNDPPPPQAEAATEDCEGTGPDRAPEPEPLAVSELPGSSKRWGSIFHKIRDKRGLDSSPAGGGGGEDRSTKEKDLIGGVKEKRRDQKKVSAGGGGGGVVAAAELNINIWPFSRSRSAGNGGNRPRSAANRKVSSAPCSRSNSTGESKLRKWPPNSPSRGGGVHLGRSSPVLQIRRGGAGRRAEAYLGGEGGGKGEGSEGRRKVKAPPSRGRGVSRGRVLSLNVPMCIGYRHNLSCKSDENSAVGVAAAAAAVGGGVGQVGGAVAGEGARRGHLFNIKSLFTKKVY
ncbi:cytochrome b6 [Striga asiatica]|uniref:Cytochrome b6 n=1 Tax=Striga asiatica TaxID=4170 RepID=A0A5A7RGL1_STRAF|nr:cytochrome b6 [Striga asiatica]